MGFLAAQDVGTATVCRSPSVPVARPLSQPQTHGAGPSERGRATGDRSGLYRLAWHALVGVLLLAALLLPLAMPTAHAAPRAIDPREIALTPADLPTGFKVDPATNGVSLLPASVGVMYRVDMQRTRTPEALRDGPVMVQQMIVRIDGDMPAGQALAEVRDDLVTEVEMTSTSDGPNDGGTISLKRTGGDYTMYSIGYVKGPMVIVTSWGGSADVTTFPKLIELAGITSARLDAALNRYLGARPAELHNARPASSAGLTVPRPGRGGYHPGT